MKDILIDIRKQFKDLQFNQERHAYTVNGKKLISVSGLLKDFHKPFDSETISKFVATSRGITQEEVLKEWRDKGNKARRFGTRVHDFAERYVTDRFKLDSKIEYYSVYQQLAEGEELHPKEQAVVKFWEDRPAHLVPVCLELKMFSEELEYAGTADIILLDTRDNSLVIGDYKTNEDLFKQYKNQKLLNPFSEMDDNPFNKYQLQLSFYQMLLEKAGFKVSARLLVWLLETGEYKTYWTTDYSNELTKYLKDKMNYASW